MKKMLLFVPLVLVLLFACTTMKISEAQFSRSTVATRSLGDFKITVQVAEFFGASGGANLFNISATSMDEKISDAIMDEVMARGGDAAVDVTIVYQANFGHILLNAVTATIYAPASAIITGTIVEYS